MILGLTGRMGSGKNTAAERLALLSEQPVVEVSFAAKLKQSAAALLGCTAADLERWKNHTDAFVTVRASVGDPQLPTQVVSEQTVRSFLQRYGTESHREIFGDDFWVDQALPIVSHDAFDDVTAPVAYRDVLYVATDVRFPNEAQRVRDLGGHIVRIVGPNETTGDHPSEQVLPCDVEIDNTVRDDGFAWLDAQLSSLLGAIGADRRSPLAA